MQKEQVHLIIAIIVASLFVLLLVIALLILFRIFLKRKNSLLFDNQMMILEFEQTQLRSRIEIQEETLSQVSREIHDNIGQVLSMIRIHLHSLEDGKEKIQLLDDLMEKAITDLRSLSRTLNTEYIQEAGWVSAVERLFFDLRKTGRYTTSIEVEEDLPSLTNENSIILFRMIQEIINNTLKHAEATHISLRASLINNQILITIADNGRGFDPSLVQPGTGLKNIQHRSKQINSKMEIESNLGLGTSFSISINSFSNG